MAPQRKATLEMLLCAALWSIAGIFIKHIPWNPLVIAGFRSLIAAGVLVLFMKCRKIRLHCSPRILLSSVLMCATFLAFVCANKLTTSANAIVLQFTAPVFLLLYSALLFRQKLKRPDVLAVFVTLGGIALFFFDQLSPGHILGNCVAILAGAVMAGMYLAVGRMDMEARFSGALFGHLMTAVIGVPCAALFPTPVSADAVLNILVLGVFQLGLAYVLFLFALEHCPPLACSLLGAVEPLLNPVWVFLFDGEAPGLFALLGGAIVIAAVTIWCIWRDQQTAHSEPSPAA